MLLVLVFMLSVKTKRRHLEAGIEPPNDAEKESAVKQVVLSNSGAHPARDIELYSRNSKELESD